jgi:hypothetical protein
MANKRGPKRKSRARRMLALFEHVWVMSRSALNETQLDIEYDRTADGSKRSVGEIRSVFRFARVRGKPLPGNVLSRLEADPVMSGLASHVGSVFWELLENPPVTRGQARSMVNKSLARLSSARAVARAGGGKTDDCASSESSALCDVASPLEWAGGTVDALIAMYPASLDLIALLGALSREAWFCFQTDEAAFFGTKFWILLQDFLSQPGMERLEGVLDEYAVDRIVYWRDESKCGNAWLPHGDETLPDSCIGEMKLDAHW